MSLTSESKNLKAIAEGIKQHNKSCDFPAAKVLMNPFEVDRLDWDDILGVPIEGDSNIPTGRFRIVCANDLTENEEETVEAIAEERELIPA